MSSIDPMNDYESDLEAALAVVYDGLVGFRRDGGVAGYELVPDLAEQLPKSTDNGTTYSFDIRPNVHYSDGELVRASDFVRGMQRLLSFGNAEYIGYFAKIQGAAACIAHAAQCDLSQGVVADDQRGQVVFHLTQSDPDFLAKLGLFALASPAPPGTPMTHDVGTQPVPGTGPYMISQFTPKQSLTLVRNPRFVQWSSAAQPNGYPSTIHWQPFPDENSVVSAVESGHADVVFLNSRTDNIPLLIQQYGEQVKTFEADGISFLLLNSGVAPFNNLMARQAVAEALTADKAISLIDDNGMPLCTLVSG